MLKILAIDTSGSICSLALQSAGTISSRNTDAERQSAQRILPMLGELLAEHKLKLDELDAIAVMAGPGSFTGLRIGIAVAQGLSMANNIPLIPVSNLAAQAAAVFRILGDGSSLDTVLVCDLARESEIYYAAYQKSSDLGVKLLGNEQLGLAEALIVASEVIDSPRLAASGNAWLADEALHSKLAAGCDLEVVPAKASLEDLLSLATIKLGRNETVVGAELRPNYVREELDYS